MAEFKVTPALSAEITAIQTACDTLDSAMENLSADGVDTLKTSVAYIEEHNAIISLLELYKQLLDKEIADLRLMKKAAEDMDAKAAGRMK